MRQKKLIARVLQCLLVLGLVATSGCIRIAAMQVGRQGLTQANYPPSLQFLQSTYNYAVLSAIDTEFGILRNGAVESCTISPSLPAGMTWDSVNCAFSGTASATPMAQVYTVTASNARGSSTATFEIVFYQIVPAIAYAQTSYTFPIASASSTGAVQNTGGSISSCSVNPALPAGLTLNTTNCAISGTPNAPSAQATYSVQATNSAGNSATTNVNITVANVAPQLAYSQSSYTFTMNSASTTGTPTNSGGVATACTVSPALAAGLSIHATSCAISGTPSAPLANTTYTVTASNAVGSTTANVQLEVLNIAPALAYSSGSYSMNLNAASTTGTPVNSGGAIVSCSVAPALPAGLTLNAANCSISGTPSAVTAASTYTVTATNAIGSHAVTLEIAVLNVAPSITFASSTYAFDLASSVTTDVPSNAGGAITACAISPALSAGLTLSNTTCAISGTPSALTSPSAMAYTITPSNAIGSGAAVTVTVTVNDVVPALTFSSSSYGFTLFSAGTTGTPVNGGGAITACDVSPALPSGLSLSQTTCAISGTPTTTLDTTQFTVTPQNSVGSGPSVTLDLQVANIPPQIAYSSSTFAFDLQSSADTAAPTNSGGGITGCTVSPALPAGLTLNTSTCRISGTPTAVSAATNYTVTPSNATGNGNGVVVSVEVRNIAPQLTFSSNSYAFTMNSAISAISPTNTGGVATSCSSTPSLPAGLSLSNTCEITGTPTTAQTAANYQIVGSNAVGSDSARTITITVNTIAPVIAYSGAPFTFTKGSAISTQTPSNSGGSITSCTVSKPLPTGLNLSSSCVLSGTPSAVSAQGDYVITATNSAGSGSATVSITVNDIAPSITYSGAPFVFRKSSSVGTNSVTNTGGTIVSCSVSPALPAGLSLNATTCAITGTPTAITATANYTVSATNSGGTGTRVISVTVNDALPVIVYSQSQYAAAVSEEFSTGVPTLTGGALTNCTVDAALPAGLSIDKGSCEIAGTIEESEAGSFTFNVTPSSSGGAGASVQLCIAISTDKVIGICGGIEEL